VPRPLRLASPTYVSANAQGLFGTVATLAGRCNRKVAHEGSESGSQFTTFPWITSELTP
jgi:hypothetical protein